MFTQQQTLVPAAGHAGRFLAFLFQKMGAAFRRLTRERANRRLEQHLSAMDDAMLRDLGIERQRIHGAVRSGRR
ncbi:DUF1127 domain-containing protein [Skermanella mucosa]|uniref:DUF1127 domain-containing protein n=1 Tax=Skermanella mucosa TaxID=1789672 RepID=UPI00192CC8A2|nr:DUF1127 domain-containing protein [Skermanella mucosa]UEM22168.1 DUF1127 domain-containing protein [Skermanella mucosa]